MRTVRVLIVDDQARFRRAAAAVVESLDGFAFVGAALDGKSRPGAVATVLLTGARGAVRRQVLLDIVSCTAARGTIESAPRVSRPQLRLQRDAGPQGRAVAFMSARLGR